MHGSLPELLHRLIVLLDLLWGCSKDQIGLWALISEVVEEMFVQSMRRHILAIDA